MLGESGNIGLSVLCERKLVALVGNPNAGKTTLFNALTGHHQRVGNYPGVTVEKKTGLLRSHAGEVELLDLPGCYTLAARSADDGLVLDVLLGQKAGAPGVDLIVAVVDATNLTRNLFLTSQILEIGKPVVVAVTMVDLAEASGIVVDEEALSHELGVPVVLVVAPKRQGVDRLAEAIVSALGQEASPRCPDFPSCVCAELDGLSEAVADGGFARNEVGASRVELLQTLLDPGGYHERQLVKRCGRGFASELAQCRRRLADAGESLPEVEARVRYAWLDRVVERVVTRPAQPRVTRSEAVDRILTNRVVGLAVLAVLMGACFQSIYAWAAPVMNAIESAFSFVGNLLAGAIPPGALQSLVVDGIISGVGAVLVFLPQILILFLFIAILEDCGYMARAAFLLDRWMNLIGLNGLAFIPLLSSFACAVPGIMSTRMIENRRDRFVTIFIAPLMSCSARLPVYLLMIAAFIPAKPLLGGLIGLQAVTLLAMYCVGIAVAIPVALILKRTVLHGEAQPFLMELPTYKWPSIRTVLHRMYQQGREFCLTAGTIIFAFSIIVWALGYYPRPASIAAKYATMRTDAVAEYEAAIESSDTTRHQQIQREGNGKIGAGDLSATVVPLPAPLLGKGGRKKGDLPGNGTRIKREAGSLGPNANPVLTKRLEDIDRREAGAYLRQSMLGRIGGFIEPIVKPLGWDWRIGTAVVAAFPAREVVLATLGTIYNLGSNAADNSTTLRDRLHAAKWPDDRPVYSIPVALSIMVFFALCCQCGSTLAVMKRETGTWAWPIASFTFMTTLAYVAAFLTYVLANRWA